MKKLLLLLALLLPSCAFAQNVAGCAGTSGTPLITGITGTGTTDANVTNGATYFYAVRAVDATGNISACSNVATANIPAAGTGTHTVTLSWTASTTSGVTYELFRSQAPAPPTNLQVTVN